MFIIQFASKKWFDYFVLRLDYKWISLFQNEIGRPLTIAFVFFWNTLKYFSYWTDVGAIFFLEVTFLIAMIERPFKYTFWRRFFFFLLLRRPLNCDNCYFFFNYGLQVNFFVVLALTNLTQLLHRWRSFISLEGLMIILNLVYIFSYPFNTLIKTFLY